MVVWQMLSNSWRNQQNIKTGNLSTATNSKLVQPITNLSNIAVGIDAYLFRYHLFIASQPYSQTDV